MNHWKKFPTSFHSLILNVSLHFHFVTIFYFPFVKYLLKINKWTKRPLPLQVQFEAATCEINNSLDNEDCQTFTGQTNSTSTNTISDNCIVDITFNYTFTNVGLFCFEVANVKAKLGPLVGVNNLALNKYYGYGRRKICTNDSWTLSDKRLSVNLCEKTKEYSTWEMVLDVYDRTGRSTNTTLGYNWIFTTEPSIFPSTAPSIFPSTSPTFDTCRDCTLTTYMSGGKF